jgi:hypothetical protein
VVGSLQQRLLRRAIGEAKGWAAATGIGLGVGFVVAFSMGQGSGLAGKALEGAIHGSAIGAIIGLLQWLVLRPRIPAARWWVAVSIAGWSMGAATGDAVGYFTGGPFDLMTGIVVAAAVTGAGLIVVLRPRGQVPVSTGARHAGLPRS